MDVKPTGLSDPSTGYHLTTMACSMSRRNCPTESNQPIKLKRKLCDTEPRRCGTVYPTAINNRNAHHGKIVDNVLSLFFTHMQCDSVEMAGTVEGWLGLSISLLTLHLHVGYLGFLTMWCPQGSRTSYKVVPEF